MSSRIIVDTIEGSGAAKQITVSSGHKLIAPGHVLQCKVTRYDGYMTYSTGGGNELTPLRVSITPMSPTSLILCMFQIHGECGSTHDVGYRVFKNGAVATGAYAGYNTTAGDVPYSMASMALPYESDYSSTPFTKTFLHMDYPGSTDAVTYAPAVKDSYNSSYTWYLNRSASTPQNGYESGISYTFVWEIAS